MYSERSWSIVSLSPLLITIFALNLGKHELSLVLVQKLTRITVSVSSHIVARHLIRTVWTNMRCAERLNCAVRLNTTWNSLLLYDCDLSALEQGTQPRGSSFAFCQCGWGNLSLSTRWTLRDGVFSPQRTLKTIYFPLSLKQFSLSLLWKREMLNSYFETSESLYVKCSKTTSGVMRSNFTCPKTT